MRHGRRIVGDERLLLRRERFIHLGIGRAVQADGEAPLVDQRPHVDDDVERRRPELLEPEAELLDEVERQAVAPGRPGRRERRLELDRLARAHDIGEGGSRAVPDDRVAERIEPVVRELHTLASARPPRRRACVLEDDVRSRRHARALLGRARTHATAPRAGPRAGIGDARRLAPFAAASYSRSPVQVGEIAVEGVARRFRVHGRDARTLKDLFVQRGKTDAIDVWALRDVSAQVGRGEAVGLIGRNGSGKTTLLRLIAGIIKPTAGRIRTEGRIGSLLELGAGFHMDFTGRENVFLNGAIQGLPRAEIKRRFDEIVAFAELENAIDRPVRTYSSGMTMRLGFAIAAFLDADILLLDEVFAVGDEAFQRKCFGRIFAFKEKGGTIVFVSHDASAVERLCERSVFLEGGQVAFDGPTREAVTRYRRALADDANPAERGVGLREWGSGEASIASAALVGHEGADRLQFLSGEPFELRVAVDADGIPPPRLQLELRDDAGTLVAGHAVDLRSIGWAAGNGHRDVRFHMGALPLADGRFHLRLGLTDEAGRARLPLARRRARVRRLSGG